MGTKDKVKKTDEDVIDILKSLDSQNIKRIYSGRIGCACGCRGKYHEGKSIPRVLKNMINFIDFVKLTTILEGQDLDGYNYLSCEDAESNRVYTIYYESANTTTPAIIVFEDDSFELTNVNINGNSLTVVDSKKATKPDQITVKLLNKDGVYRELVCVAKPTTKHVYRINKEIIRL